jgi:hypothetical protein
MLPKTHNITYSPSISNGSRPERDNQDSTILPSAMMPKNIYGKIGQGAQPDPDALFFELLSCSSEESAPLPLLEDPDG